MEYANGGELFDYIVANTRIKEPLACKLFLQLISGIEYIHKLGIVHRDLKPENLLLDNKKNIKIVDFGLSNTYQPEELLKTACGSPCYAAPEMIAGKKYLGLNSDIWSAGVILFAMVCGYLPFEDPDTSKLYKKILAGDFSCPSFISGTAKDLIARILDTNPETRYTIEDIRNHPWARQVDLEVSNGILVGYENIVVDPEILRQLEQFGFDIEHTQKCIEANKHNSLTAAYFLLLKKHIEGGGDSIADYSKLNETEIQPSRLNQTSSHTPKPPLFKLSSENIAPVFQRVRKYGNPNKRSVSRRCARINYTIQRPSTKPAPRTSSIPQRRPLKHAISGFKASTPRPPQHRLHQTTVRNPSAEGRRFKAAHSKSSRTASM